MSADVDEEFARQLAVLTAAGLPGLAGMSDDGFAALIDPLRHVVRSHAAAEAGGAGSDRAAWLIVVSPSLIGARDLVPLLRLPAGRHPGIVDRNHGADDLEAYRPVPELHVPDASAYVLFDVDRGDEFRGVRPRDAVPVILSRGRTPLTIHEGLAFALLQPTSIERNRCYMLAGSRRGDKRVPALWISANAPKLGWCWEGNLHTWLGIASAGTRLAAEGAVSGAP